MITLPTLYPHQEAHKDRVKAALKARRSVILQAEPGVGKTVISKWILGSYHNAAKTDKQSGHALFAVYGRGLVDNATNSFRQEPALPHAVLMSGRDCNPVFRIQVASIDTLLSWFCESGYQWDMTFDLVFFDECVTGDAIVETELGAMRLDEIPTRLPRFVKTYTESQGIHFARVLDWKHKGKHPTLEVHTHAGKITCTADHKIFTRRGWLQAQDLSLTDEILASVDAGPNHQQGGFSAGATNPRALESSYGLSGMDSIGMDQSAVVGVEYKPGRPIKTLTHGCATGIFRDLSNTPKATRTARQTKLSSSRHLRGRQSLGRFLVTRRSGTHTKGHLHQGCTVPTVMFRRNGQTTRLNSFTGSMPPRVSRKTLGGAKHQSAPRRRVTPALLVSTISLRVAGKKGCRGIGSTASATLGLHGGSVMTARQPRHPYSCTLKAFQKSKTRSSLSGSVIISERPPSAGTKLKTPISSTSPAGHRSRSARELSNTFQNSCGTSWCRVTQIVPAKSQAVYDIEVEGSHCFFANNLLVHNCHAHHSKFHRFLKAHAAKREELGLAPPFVIGLTATPEAKGLADVYREIVKGESPEWLIANGFLKPYRYFHATDGKLGLLVKRGGEFTKDSVSAAMEGLSGDLVRDWKRLAEGRATVGFFPRRTHAKEAQELLKANGVKAHYLDGETDDDKRLWMYEALNSGEIDYICNVNVMERGTDVPRVSCIQMCTSVGSRKRWRQMIARGSRPHRDCEDCIVIDHGGNLASDRQLGFFEDEVDWTLDVTTKPAGEEGVRPTIECPGCSAVYRGGRCRSCGYEPTPKERKAQGLTFDGATLQEIKPREQKAAKKKTCEEIMISALYQAGKSGRTWKQAMGIAYRLAEKQGTRLRIPKEVVVGGKPIRMLPYGHPDGGQRVRHLFEGKFS